MLIKIGFGFIMRFKKYLFSIILFSFVFHQKIISQDTIIRVSGDIILGTVVEIGDNEIVYKKDGIIYNEGKAGVNMIKYSNGEYFKIDKSIAPNSNTQSLVLKNENKTVDYKIYVDGKLFKYTNKYVNESYILSVLSNSDDGRITNLVNSAKRNQAEQSIQFGAIPLFGACVGAIFVSSQFSSNPNSNSYNPSQKTRFQLYAVACGALALACPAISLVLRDKKNKITKEAIKLYNEKY